MHVFTSLAYYEKLFDTALPLMRSWKSVTHVFENTFQSIDFQSDDLEFKPIREEYIVKSTKKTNQKLKAEVFIC